MSGRRWSISALDDNNPTAAMSTYSTFRNSSDRLHRTDRGSYSSLNSHMSSAGSSSTGLRSYGGSAQLDRFGSASSINQTSSYSPSSRYGMSTSLTEHTPDRSRLSRHDHGSATGRLHSSAHSVSSTPTSYGHVGRTPAAVASRPSRGSSGYLNDSTARYTSAYSSNAAGSSASAYSAASGYGAGRYGSSSISKYPASPTYSTTVGGVANFATHKPIGSSSTSGRPYANVVPDTTNALFNELYARYVTNAEPSRHASSSDKNNNKNTEEPNAPPWRKRSNENEVAVAPDKKPEPVPNAMDFELDNAIADVTSGGAQTYAGRYFAVASVVQPTNSQISGQHVPVEGVTPPAANNNNSKGNSTEAETTDKHNVFYCVTSTHNQQESDKGDQKHVEENHTYNSSASEGESVPATTAFSEQHQQEFSRKQEEELASEKQSIFGDSQPTETYDLSLPVDISTTSGQTDVLNDHTADTGAIENEQKLDAVEIVSVNIDQPTSTTTTMDEWKPVEIEVEVQNDEELMDEDDANFHEEQKDPCTVATIELSAADDPMTTSFSESQLVPPWRTAEEESLSNEVTEEPGAPMDSNEEQQGPVSLVVMSGSVGPSQAGDAPSPWADWWNNNNETDELDQTAEELNGETVPTEVMDVTANEEPSVPIEQKSQQILDQPSPWADWWTNNAETEEQETDQTEHTVEVTEVQTIDQTEDRTDERRLTDSTYSQKRDLLNDEPSPWTDWWNKGEEQEENDKIVAEEREDVVQVTEDHEVVQMAVNDTDEHRLTDSTYSQKRHQLLNDEPSPWADWWNKGEEEQEEIEESAETLEVAEVGNNIDENTKQNQILAGEEPSPWADWWNSETNEEKEEEEQEEVAKEDHQDVHEVTNSTNFTEDAPSPWADWWNNDARNEVVEPIDVTVMDQGITEESATNEEPNDPNTDEVPHTAKGGASRRAQLNDEPSPWADWWCTGGNEEKKTEEPDGEEQNEEDEDNCEVSVTIMLPSSTTPAQQQHMSDSGALCENGMSVSSGSTAEKDKTATNANELEYRPPPWASFAADNYEEEEQEEDEEAVEENADGETGELAAAHQHKRVIMGDEIDNDSGLGTPPVQRGTMQQWRNYDNTGDVDIGYSKYSQPDLSNATGAGGERADASADGNRADGIEIESDACESDAESLASEPPVGTTMQRRLNEAGAARTPAALHSTRSEPHLLKPPNVTADPAFISSMESSRLDSDEEDDDFDLGLATAAAETTEKTQQQRYGGSRSGCVVDPTLALPAPVFNMSVTLDESWDSAHEESVEDVSDFEDLMSTVDDDAYDYDDDDDDYDPHSLAVHSIVDSDDATPLYTPNSSRAGSHDEWRETPVRVIRLQDADEVAEAADAFVPETVDDTSAVLEPLDVPQTLSRADAVKPVTMAAAEAKHAEQTDESSTLIKALQTVEVRDFMMNLDSVTHGSSLRAAQAVVPQVLSGNATSTDKLSTVTNRGASTAAIKSAASRKAEPSTSKQHIKAQLEQPLNRATSAPLDDTLERAVTFTRGVAASKPPEVHAKKSVAQPTSYCYAKATAPPIVREPLFRDDGKTGTTSGASATGAPAAVGAAGRRSSREDDYLVSIEKARTAMAKVAAGPAKLLASSAEAFDKQIHEMRSRLEQESTNRQKQIHSFSKGIELQTDAARRAAQESELHATKKELEMTVGTAKGTYQSWKSKKEEEDRRREEEKLAAARKRQEEQEKRAAAEAERKAKADEERRRKDEEKKQREEERKKKEEEARLQREAEKQRKEALKDDEEKKKREEAEAKAKAKAKPPLGRKLVSPFMAADKTVAQPKATTSAATESTKAKPPSGVAKAKVDEKPVEPPKSTASAKKPVSVEKPTSVPTKTATSAASIESAKQKTAEEPSAAMKLLAKAEEALLIGQKTTASGLSKILDKNIDRKTTKEQQQKQEQADAKQLPKPWKPHASAKLYQRKKRYTRPCTDIDELFNDDKENTVRTFEQFEHKFDKQKKSAEALEATQLRRKMRRKRLRDGKRADADEVIFDKSDFREFMRSVSPTSKVSMNFFDGLDDSTEATCGLQIYRAYDGGSGDFGTYLDNELALSDQPDELEILKNDTRRTSLILRTQPSVRVQAITDKLLNSTGRELRRALFTLKQIFQDDNDLVQEFVQHDGLSCLVKVGNTCDSNYQNYILRALGQIMLYLDGMNGVIAHNETIQWLYSLLSSPYRLVAKTALKLLVVFVEYTESNALLLLAAVYAVDRNQGRPAWTNVMSILNDTTNADAEFLAIVMTMVNKTLNGIPDQDTYFDIVDAFEAQGMESTQQRLAAINHPELRDQCKLYDATLNNEDQTDDHEDGGLMAKMRTPSQRNGFDRRPANRRGAQHQHKQQQQHAMVNGTADNISETSASSAKTQQSNNSEQQQQQQQPNWRQKPAQSGQAPKIAQTAEAIANGLSPLKQERDETSGKTTPGKLSLSSRQPSQNTEQSTTSTGEASPALLRAVRGQSPGTSSDNQSIASAEEARIRNSRCPPPMMPVFADDDGQTPTGAEPTAATANAEPEPEPETSQTVVIGVEEQPDDTDEDVTVGCASSFASALARARKGMDKKQSGRGPVETRKESEIQWEKAREQFKSRPLIINDLDFSELNDEEDDQDPLRISPRAAAAGIGLPPPPPMLGKGPMIGAPPPPPLPGMPGMPPPPPMSMTHRDPSPGQSKDVKTVKLFWKEAQLDAPVATAQVASRGVFWERIKPPSIDQEKLAQLFETKTKEILPKDGRNAKREMDKKAEIRVLGTKRSNAINIGLTKLPPPRNIKQAILKFDSSILNKEGLEKIIQTMLPSAEEKEKIEEAQAEQPDLPLGAAEQFLMLLASVPDLLPRLKLWLFMMDYAGIEKEVAEPLMDLKLAMEELENSETFQYVMATLLAVGNYLNGAEVKGFQLDYLAKVPEVKDTVHKHSLVHHLCAIVMDRYPESTDLYSDLGAVARCAKVDFDEIRQNLDKLEHDCKSSWDYLRIIAKHESINLKQKIGDFLTDCAQRILALKTIHRRVINRFRKFLLYMGMGLQAANETKVNTLCKTVSEFALEYRTSRERILQQRKRLLEKRERNKTRGKMWIQQNSVDSNAGVTQNGQHSSNDHQRHEELSRALLAKGEPGSSQLSNDWRQRRLKPTQERVNQIVQDRNAMRKEDADTNDDEILDGLVKAATAGTDQPRETRRRARQFNRKSMRRTRTLKLVEDQIGTPVC